MSDQEVKIRIRALDRMSKVMEKVRAKFPKLDRAINKTSRTFKKVNASSKKFFETLKKRSGAMTAVGQKMTAGITLPVAAAGVGILTLGVNFQASMNKVGAITGTVVNGKITPAFTELREKALELGSTTEFSATQAADAMGFLGRAGFKTNEIIAAIPNTLALATASGSDLAFTADVMSKTIRQFGMDASEAGRVADVFSDVARRTNVDLTMINETMADAGPIAKQYGASFEQASALTGLLGDIGIQGSKAGTAIKNIMIQLAKPSDTGLKILDRLGISVKKANGEMMSAGEVLTELGPKISGLHKGNQLAIMAELFGLRGIAGAMGLMSRAMDEGKDPVGTLTKLLENSTGAAADMQKTMNMGAVGSVNRFKSALEGLGLAFADSGILDAFAKLTDKVTELLGWLTGADEDLLAWAFGLALVAAVVGPLLIALGSLVGLVANLAILFPVIGTSMIPMAITAGIVALKVLLIVGAIALLGYTINRLVKRWDHMVAAFKKSKGVISGIGNFIKAFFTDEDEAGTGRIDERLKKMQREGGTAADVQKTLGKGNFAQMPAGDMENIAKQFFPDAGNLESLTKVADTFKGGVMGSNKQLAGVGDKLGMLNTGTSLTNRKLDELIQVNRQGVEGQGIPISGDQPRKVFGPPVGAKRSLKQVSNQSTVNTNNARVDINVQAPSGTRVRTKADRPDLMGLNLGVAGGMQ